MLEELKSGQYRWDVDWVGKWQEGKIRAFWDGPQWLPFALRTPYLAHLPPHSPFLL